jgi:predicted ATPase
VIGARREAPWVTTDEQVSVSGSQALLRVPDGAAVFHDIQDPPWVLRVKDLADDELSIAQVRDPSRFVWPFWIVRFLEEIRCYRELRTGADAPIRRAQRLDSSTRLVGSGDNLASVLSALRETPQYRDAFDEVESRLVAACPEFERINIPTHATGKAVVALQHTAFPARHFAAPQLSDGVLKFLCLCAILLSPDPPPLICIDEPEVGLHPGMMPHIAEMLHDAAERTQLIVATHSPQLVDYLDAGDIVVAEVVDGASEMTRLDPDDLREWLTEFRLGDLWMMGHLGGRPE